MRGTGETSGSLFSYVDLEDRIPARHPLRKIRQVVNDALASLDADFEGLYVRFGRPSFAPERLIRASLLQILFSIRSERQLMEQMNYNLLFRWFVGLGIDDAVWVPTVFTKNRDRLMSTEMSRKIMAAILAHREVAPLLSDEHFSVDGTLVKAWASMKSFQPKAPPPRPMVPMTVRVTKIPARRRQAPPPTRPRPKQRPIRCPAAPARTAMPRSFGHSLELIDGVRALTSRRETLECDACFDDRSRRAALQEIPRHRCHAVLHRPCADGEPQRPDRAERADPG